MNKNQNPIMLKVRKGGPAGWNHNESALKVRKMLSPNHNETALKVRKAMEGPVTTNHNETALKVRKALDPNHNQAALNVRKGMQINHNESALKVRKGLLVLALVLGANAWLHTFQPGMIVPDGPEVTSMAGSDVVPDGPEASRIDPYKN